MKFFIILWVMGAGDAGPRAHHAHGFETRATCESYGANYKALHPTEAVRWDCYENAVVNPVKAK